MWTINKFYLVSQLGTTCEQYVRIIIILKEIKDGNGHVYQKILPEEIVNKENM